MKLVHISDIHIHPAAILGHDPVENFARCLDHVAAFQADADMIVITGDLTHRGDRDSYLRLAEMIAGVDLPAHLAPRLLIGNHDHRPTFCEIFGDTPRDENGFVQWSETTPAGTFLYLDSVKPGADAGQYCPMRRAWLIRELKRARNDGQPVYLFMHHNPVTIHVANADVIGMEDEADFQAVLKSYSDVIRHIFFGHCHFTLSGAVCGIPYSAPRSTNHTCWPDFSGISTRMGYGQLAPNYNVCFLGETHTTVHSIDFLDQDKVAWRHDPVES